MSDRGPLFQRYLPFRAFRGERGVLYLCSDLETHGAVALKSFEPELATGHTATSLIGAANRWLRIGSHPHVVAAHRIEQHSPLCLVLDFVEPAAGLETPSLRGWLHAPIAPEAACAVALGIVRGMRHATDQVPELVHGNLRPENVLVGRDLRARVTDFGLGQVEPPPPASDEASRAACYWAPERWNGETRQRSDVYAFGVILAEMLLGSDAVVSAAAARSAASVRDRVLRSDVPGGLRALLAACLAPTPDLRPASWVEIDRRLNALWPTLSGRDVPQVPDEATAMREEELMRAWSSHAIGHALLERGAFDAALVTYRGVARTAARLRDPMLEASAVSHVAVMLRSEGNLDAAMRELLHALDLRRSLRDARGQADVMCLLGDVYARKGELDNALASFFAAARLFAEVGDRMGIATCRQQMSPVLRAAGRHNEAREAEAEAEAILADLDT